MGSSNADRASRAGDGRDSFGVYLRELGRRPLLPRGADLELARSIADADVNVWRLLFGYAPATEHVVAAVRALLPPDIRRPRQLGTVARVARTGSQPEFARAALAAALAVRRRDLRREVARGVRRRLRSAPVKSRRWLSAVAAAARTADRLRGAFAEANLRLVVSIARKYTGNGLDMADLVSHGNLGLLRAIDGFDPDRGFRFSTYATWWIRQFVGRALQDEGRTVRVPVHAGESARRLHRVERRLRQELQRLPTDDEVLAAAGISREKLRLLRECLTRPVELDAPIASTDQGGGAPLVEFFADHRPSPIDAVAAADDIRVAERLLAALDVRERIIVRRRFGIGCDEQTLEVIGEQLGVTRERVRQIEAAAMRKLRRAAVRSVRPLSLI